MATRHAQFRHRVTDGSRRGEGRQGSVPALVVPALGRTGARGSGVGGARAWPRALVRRCLVFCAAPSSAAG